MIISEKITNFILHFSLYYSLFTNPLKLLLIMILVRYYQTVNGNIKHKKFRKTKTFESMDELEKERKRLSKLHKATIDFTPIIDTGDDVPSNEVISTLFNISEDLDENGQVTKYYEELSKVRIYNPVNNIYCND